MRSVASFFVLVLVAASVPTLGAGDWPRFRGPNGSAVSEETGLPVTWSDTEHVDWKTELPGPGSSSPIVCGDRVFVTCYSGYGVDRSSPGDPAELTRHLVCLNLSDGSVLWQKSVAATVREDPYRGMLTDHGYASSTPAADGERVFAFFGKSGVVAFDSDGKQLWQTSVGTGSAIMGWGSATSLVLHKKLVIVNANAESQAIVALDRETGREVWRAEAKGYAGSWSTPVLVPVGDKHELAVSMPGEVWGVDPDDGGLLWYCGGIRGAATTSLVACRNGTFVLAAEPDFKVLAHNQIESDSTDFNASPAISNGRLLIRSNRFLYCIGTK